MRIPEERSLLVVVDVQERLLPVMSDHDLVTDRVVRLIRGIATLGLPMLMTEQYRKGLGPTVDPVASAFREGGGGEPIEKMAFSCCDEPAFVRALSGLGRRFVLLAGIESHVCMLQTSIDLLKAGYQPVVPADVTSSRFKEDKDFALRRLEKEGAIVTTSEALLFELTRVTGTSRFKEISKLVK